MQPHHHFPQLTKNSGLMLTRHHAFSIPVQGILIGGDCGVCPAQLLLSRVTQHCSCQKAKTWHLETASAVEVTHTETGFCTTVIEGPPHQTYFLNSFTGGRHIKPHSTMQRHKSTTMLPSSMIQEMCCCYLTLLLCTSKPLFQTKKTNVKFLREFNP